MYYHFFLLIFIFCILYFIIIYNKIDKIDNYKNIDGGYIFTYWDNIKTMETPSHIKLCFKTMEKYFKNYNFVILNKDIIGKYIKIDEKINLDKLHIAQRVDYYRIKLLEKYGGIWFDADTIILKSPDIIFNKLLFYDFVGFGCTGIECKISGYPHPSNGVMASRKNGLLISCVSKKLDDILSIKNSGFDYFDLGKKVIWSCLSNLMKNGYNYYHFSVNFDGTRDIHGKWINSINHFNNKKTQLMNENDALFIQLANYEIMNDDKYKYILQMTENDILNHDFFISYLFRKSLF